MIDLESMAVTMPEVEGHPNRAEFRGVLTVVDVPSQRAPSGSKGRRVVLTRQAAETALPSLIGMALDYAPAFDRHDARRKVGVITSAEIVGRNLEVGGYLYAKDFPEIVDEVARSGKRETEAQRERANVTSADEVRGLRASLAAAVSQLRSLTAGIRGPARRNSPEPGARGGTELGMSFEVTNVNLLDARARVWTLTDVTFTGAAILRRDKAAYHDTWIELVER
jgi:hypothetical protein